MHITDKGFILTEYSQKGQVPSVLLMNSEKYKNIYESYIHYDRKDWGG